MCVNRVLVIHGLPSGHDAAGNALWPADTATAAFFQLPLEWLGYELEYHGIAKGVPSGAVLDGCAGIILDSELELNPSMETRFADWLLEASRRGVKVVVMGAIPFKQTEARGRFMRGFNLKGVERNNVISEIEEIGKIDPAVANYEAVVAKRGAVFDQVEAPEGAAIHVSLKARDRQGKVFHSDPVFTTGWGGAILEPCLCFERPDHLSLLYVNPFEFFFRALAWENRPVPDPATAAGLRIFFSHVDADGFSNLSQVTPGRLSSEIIRDEVFRKYPIPISSSVIVAEVAGLLKGQKPGDDRRLMDVARGIYALPNIEPSSHTYSHPFYWQEADRTASFYDEQGLELKTRNGRAGIDVEKEVAGSVAFIEEKLLPPGGRVRLIQWSGNCRPGAAALKVARRLGIEDINGGDTVASRQRPGIAQVSPRIMVWGDQFQVMAGIQNEMLYTHGFAGPVYGGYQNVIQTFELTGKPRRLKPVNVYYHFFSGDRVESLRAVQHVYEWCLQQPLHAVTASSYAAMVRDARTTRVWRAEAGEWRMENRGRLASFRLKDEGLTPDMNRCQGVLGYNRQDGFLYVATDGSGKTRLVMSRDPGPHLALESSTAPISFDRLEAKEAAFEVKGWGPARVVLTGVPSAASATVVVNEKKGTAKFDSTGRLTLELPDRAKVLIRLKT